MHADWGWGTDDAVEALGYLRRFASVTCISGHVHQLFSKTEGNVFFCSGTTTASFALALLIALGGPNWLRWAAAAIAGGALVAFVASRTVGILGFSETGWETTPYEALSVGAEVLTVLLWAGLVANARRIKRGPSYETRLQRDRMFLDQEPAQRGQRQGG